MSTVTSSTITIDSDFKSVLALLEGIAEYPTWSSSIKSVEVLQSAEGHPTKVKIGIEAGPVRDLVELTYDWSKLPTSLSFTLDEGNVLTKMDGEFILKDLGGDQVQVTYQLAVELSLPIPQMMITKQEKATIESTLKELKSYLEG